MMGESRKIKPEENQKLKKTKAEKTKSKKIEDAAIAIIRKSKAQDHEKRSQYFLDRTQALIEQKVHVRTKFGPSVGIVKEIVDRPEGAKRKGRYLKIETPTEIVLRPRSRVKVIKEWE